MIRPLRALLTNKGSLWCPIEATGWATPAEERGFSGAARVSAPSFLQRRTSWRWTQSRANVSPSRRSPRGRPRSKAMEAPDLFLVDFVARDMEATIAFYRALGVDIPEKAIWRTATGAHHVDIKMPGGIAVHFDSFALARVYNRGWREYSGTGTRIVLNFRVGSRQGVDLLHERVTALGYMSAQPPIDAFWGARYAIVEDPDGNHVGLMSPSYPSLRRAPPAI